MQEIHTNTREFIRNYRKFVKRKKTVVVSKNGIPETVFMPYEEWVKSKKSGSGKKNSINLAYIIDQYTFSGGDPHLSEKIDEIVYGAPNPYRNDNA